MKKLLKKALTLSLCVCMVVGMATGASAVELEANIDSQGEIGINAIDLYNNPENYSNTTLIIYDDINEYINTIENDTNMSRIDKNKIINNAQVAQRSSIRSYKYGTIRETVRVDSSYDVYPYFYIKFEYSAGSPTPTRMVSVESANIDRNYYGMSKQFQGTLYYNLEAGNSLYWDLNGDFYNNGTTTVTGGGSAGVGGIATASFSASVTTSHYRYKNQTGRYYSAAMQP